MTLCPYCGQVVHKPMTLDEQVKDLAALIMYQQRAIKAAEES